MINFIKHDRSCKKSYLNTTGTCNNKDEGQKKRRNFDCVKSMYVDLTAGQSVHYDFMMSKKVVLHYS